MRTIPLKICLNSIAREMHLKLHMRAVTSFSKFAHVEAASPRSGGQVLALSNDLPRAPRASGVVSTCISLWTTLRNHYAASPHHCLALHPPLPASMCRLFSCIDWRKFLRVLCESLECDF